MKLPKQVIEDRQITSWRHVSTTPIDVHIPDYMQVSIINKAINEIVQPKFSDIVSASTRYTNNFYFYRGDTIIGQAINLYGEYTQLELDLLAHWCNKECVVYDIGANIGYHTQGFAHMAKHVYAFEPNLKNIKLLEKNTSHLPNVTIIRKAVGDVAGVSYISDYNLDQFGNYGECMMTDKGQRCEVIKLDDMNLPLPDIIKIDVEGYELKVIEGCKEIIRKKNPAILYESIHGTGFDLIYDFLHDELGYKIYWVPSPNFNPNNFRKNQNNIFGYGGVVNCLALPKTLPIVSNLEQMTDRDDTHIKFFERMREKHVNK